MYVFKDPPGGRSDGACRSGTGVGVAVEWWRESEAMCQDRCGRAATCVAYEYQSINPTRGYSKCELHSMEVTHTVPVSNSVCRVKANAHTKTAGRPPPPPPPAPAGKQPAVASFSAVDLTPKRGCVALAPRADYSQHGAAECFGSGTGSCGWPVLPSGMAVPRHNVPHYAGNGPWDGQGLSFEGALSAMLGDPFQYTPC